MISKQKLLFLSLFFWMNFVPVLVFSNVKPAHLISPFLLSSEPINEQETTQSNQEKDSLLVIEDLEKAQNLVHINDKKAFQLTQKALETAKSINQPVLVGKAQNALGNLHWFSGDYNRASSYYFDALKTYQSTKSQYEIGICYRNIAWIYLGQKKFKETEKYFKKSLEIMLQLQRKREILIGYDDLATLFLTQHDYKKGLEYSNKSLSIARSLGNNEATGSTLMTKGSIELKLKQYDSAIKSFEESIFLLQPIPKATYNSCLSMHGLAEVYFALHNNEKALFYSDKNIETAKKGNFLKELADAFFLKASILKNAGKVEEAFAMMKAYAETKDTLNSKNNSQYIQSMAASFEMKQNEMHIQNLEQKQKLNQAELSKERSFKLYLIIILLLAMVLTVIAYRSFLNKKKDNQALSIAYAEIETINKDISDSINYALNIQHARLPQMEKLKESFADCFVIYMPRDNVSGDFFWHNKNEDGKNVFAIADCTGHGIPGAFMSMMGIDGFNYAILEKRIDRPGEILTLVNRFIKDSLNQDHDAALSKDGMDVALCTFNADFSTVQYAGANRPLWINRNGEILDFKAQKLSIGGNHHGNYTFTDESIALQKGDLIYLFSDGYVDQFGGIKGKKFMSKQLKDALSKLSDLSCEQQEKELLRLFHEWKGNLAQVDDVVLVGIRV